MKGSKMSKYDFIYNIWMQLVIAISTLIGFIGAFFMEIALSNSEQYLAVTSVVLLDGFFGVIAGIKREGFKTYRALKILRTLFSWILILTVLLTVEVGFVGTGWISETILVPFIIFQLISALKNASMAGFIKADVVNNILDAIDKHKGDRTVSK